MVSFCPPGAADVEKAEEKTPIDLTPIVVEDKGGCGRAGRIAFEGPGLELQPACHFLLSHGTPLCRGFLWDLCLE